MLQEVVRCIRVYVNLAVQQPQHHWLLASCNTNPSPPSSHSLLGCTLHYTWSTAPFAVALKLLPNSMASYNFGFEQYFWLESNNHSLFYIQHYNYKLIWILNNLISSTLVTSVPMVTSCWQYYNRNIYSTYAYGFSNGIQKAYDGI